MPLKSVDVLSDDECSKPSTVPTFVPPAKGLKRSKRPGKKRSPHLVQSTADPQKLRHLIMSACGCTLSCFLPFRENYSLWEKWLHLRNLFDKMTKLEKDQYVWPLKQRVCVNHYRSAISFSPIPIFHFPDSISRCLTSSGRPPTLLAGASAICLTRGAYCATVVSESLWVSAKAALLV